MSYRFKYILNHVRNTGILPHTIRLHYIVELAMSVFYFVLIGGKAEGTSFKYEEQICTFTTVCHCKTTFMCVKIYVTYCSSLFLDKVHFLSCGVYCKWPVMVLQ